ncbi:MAG: DUF1279 domain-containing protein [Deltaproteobacteria bacterium]|nr:MAG: DUF1279 domain-containing protein [Deltaproteobacteria bacterium]
MTGLRNRFDELAAQYGGIAFGLWFALFFATWFLCWLGLKGGLWPDTWVPEGGRPDEGFIRAVVFKLGPQVFVAYLMTQLTKPVRILAVLTATPVVAKWVGREPAAIEVSTEEASSSEATGA